MQAKNEMSNRLPWMRFWRAQPCPTRQGTMVKKEKPLQIGKRRGSHTYHPLIFQIVLPELAP
jgi:hypothetical protein